MASLTLVRPSFGLGLANASEAGKSGDLAEPAADKDVLEVVLVAGGEDLAEGTGVELVNHLALAGRDGVLGVVLELLAVGEGLEAQLGAPLINDSLVAGVVGCGWGRFRLAGRGLRGWRAGSNVDGAGGGFGFGFRGLVDDGWHGRGLVVLLRNGGGGGSWDAALSYVDGVDDGLDDDVDVLDLLVHLLANVSEERDREGRAGKGDEGESDGGTHFE